MLNTMIKFQMEIKIITRLRVKRKKKKITEFLALFKNNNHFFF